MAEHEDMTVGVTFRPPPLLLGTPNPVIVVVAAVDTDGQPLPAPPEAAASSSIVRMLAAIVATCTE